MSDAEAQLQRRLLSLFAEELADGLQLLGPGLLALEDSAGESASGPVVQELFRAAHSLKGAAHAAAVPEAVSSCDRLESALAAIRDGERVPDAALITDLLAETDSLAVLAARLQEPSPAVTTAPAAGAAPLPAPVKASAPAPTAEPAPGSSHSPAPVLRVSADNVDAVLRHAGEGLASSRRLHELAGEAARVAERVDATRFRLRASLRSAHDEDLSRHLDGLLDDAARAVSTLARTAEATDRSAQRASSRIVEAAQRLRTQPFADACSSLERVVRDVATGAGKSARFTLVGGHVDVDRSVITALRDPLLHLVRNAVDHGLEPVSERIAAGKPEIGTVAVEAALQGSVLHVTVRDDGAGVDTTQLRAAASARGLVLPDDDADLPFVAGLSSRGDVSDVSGRGVGLDAARARLEQLGGSLTITSVAGAGTEAQLTTPVTLAVLRVLLVRAGRDLVALPSSAVDRVVQVDPQTLHEAGGAVLLALGPRSVRAVRLADAMGFSGDPADQGGDSRLAVVVPQGGDVALVTEGLLDELEVAVQPLPLQLASAPGVLGVVTLPGMLPAFVVNPVVVGRQAPSLQLKTEDPAATSVVPRILLAEDTVTTRALERSILEAAGYSVRVAVDGADAWEQLRVDGADLVVSDVDMPRMSGIELCRRIRASAQLRELPVVLVTSLDSAADRQRGLEAGADAYVVKAEFQQGTLLDTIARLL